MMEMFIVVLLTINFVVQSYALIDKTVKEIREKENE